MAKKDKREMDNSIFFGNVLIKGLVLGTITGMAHLITLTLLKKKFGL